MIEKPDLWVVLDHYGVQRGRGRVISCPLHEDRTPSCSVSPDGLWNCFSCGEGGDAWTLIQLMEGGSFSDATKFAQTHLGVGEGSAQASDERMVGSSYGGRRVFGRTGDRRDRRTYKRPWGGAR